MQNCEYILLDQKRLNPKGSKRSGYDPDPDPQYQGGGSGSGRIYVICPDTDLHPEPVVPDPRPDPICSTKNSV
jgi:hypothetical protein